MNTDICRINGEKEQCECYEDYKAERKIAKPTIAEELAAMDTAISNIFVCGVKYRTAIEKRVTNIEDVLCHTLKVLINFSKIHQNDLGIKTKDLERIMRANIGSNVVQLGQGQ